MTYNAQAGNNGARNKRIKQMVPRLVKEYLEGLAAQACMEELVREARS